MIRMAENKEPSGKAPTNAPGMQSEKETTTVHISEGKKKAFPTRTVFIYVLLLVAGLFIGIVFRLATR